MRFLERVPAGTRRSALLLLLLFAIVAVAGGMRLRAQVSSLCGNGTVNEGEECDEGGRNGIGPVCTKSCTKVRCGDGIVSQSTGEECDTGSGSVTASCGLVCSQPECDEDDACVGGCEWEVIACTASSSFSSSSSSSSSFSSSSAESFTGSSLSSHASSSVSADETSSSESSAASSVPDVGASSAIVGSFSSSASGTTLSGTGSSQSSSESPPPFIPICGDGWIHPTEECDDGNRVGDDGCSLVCKKTAVLLTRCGDGTAQAGEECDFGAANSNVLADACRTNCRHAFCGDGVLDSGEACDDGNSNEYDGCTWNCLVSVCGNGVIEVTEECDDGRKNSNVAPDVCRSVCRQPFCGDGVKDGSEECDDGNGLEDDGCLSSCFLVCPDGALKIDGACVTVEEETCGVLCSIGATWKSFTGWLFSFFS